MSLGSAGLPVDVGQRAGQRRIGLGREEHRHDHLAGGDRRGLHAHARGQLADADIQFAAEIGAVAQIRIACRFPLGTATDITPVPSGICSALVVTASCGATGVTSIR